MKDRPVSCEVVCVEWSFLFERFQQKLGQQYSKTRKVRDYTQMLKISAKHLNTICKFISARTVKQCIDDYLVEKMKRSLEISGDRMQEIALGFGFKESTNFIKYFKKHTGQSPKQFRDSFNMGLK